MAFALQAGTSFAVGVQQPVRLTLAQSTESSQACCTSAYPAPHTGGIRASRLVGATVRNVLGERLGTIHDAIIDPNGTVLYAVVAVNGVFGSYDNKYFPVPWPALRRSGDYYVLNIDAAGLRGAPSFDRDQWPDTASEAWTTSVYRYYNQRPPSLEASR